MEIKQRVLYGIHPFKEALNSDIQFEKVFVQKGVKNSNVLELVSILNKQGVPIRMVPIQKLNRLTKKNHQGIVGLVSLIAYMNFEEMVIQLYEKGKNPFLLMLDGVTDVRNIGAIARSALSFGVDSIILPLDNVAMLNEDAIKSSSGALNKIKVCRVPNLIRAIKFLKNSGLEVICISEKSEQLISNQSNEGPTVLILGDEGKGISELILKISDKILKIPMTDKMNSLNVSVATGIALYELSNLD